ncbi:hypothetical protein F5887DRAFT_1078552 [Amanita rubescens]|nr:hypothetical protein F5887DRAFT_1078552 [Amanita rubescens]
MKFLSFILFFVLPILTIAQNVVITYPPDGQNVSPGQSLTVQVSRPNSLTGSTGVSIVIAVDSCAMTPCRTPDQVLGDVLYSGPYTPYQYSNVVAEYQNFSIPIPTWYSAGPAQLNVAYFSLIGAGPFPNLQLLNSTVIVS